MGQPRGKAKRTRKPVRLRGEDTRVWGDDDLLSLATMHASCVSESIRQSGENADMVSASTGAALLANAMYLHVQGCDNVDCKECARHFRPIDFRKLAHEVLDMHLSRAVLINLEVQGEA